MTTTIVLIRHAESLASTEAVVGGHDGCRGLSLAGHQQAEALRDRLLATRELASADVLLASRLSRAVETAEVIAPGVGNGGLAIQSDCRLCEVHWGELDGRPESEIVATGAFRPVSAGGESWLGFMRRARRTLIAIAAEHRGRTVVAVTHNGIIKSSLPVYGGGNEPGAAVSCTGLTTWVLDRPGSGWRLVAYDDATHLRPGIGVPT